MREVGTVQALRRYPVKSMLGEKLAEAVVAPTGVAGDRGFALIDLETGRVASAKQPRLWRDLLQCSAAGEGRSLTITLPDGRTITSADADAALSELLGRKVRLSHDRSDGDTIARPDPEDVIEHGVTADVDYRLLHIGGAAAGATFVDYAPISIITTSTLAQVGTDWIRYRPNVVVATADDEPPFTENTWAGGEIRLGPVRVRGLKPISRCAIPTLAHGDLPANPDAVRALLTLNRISRPGDGPKPCLGVYAEVLEGGTVRPGDAAALG
jgi:uncharacterized protein YcbX